MDIKDLVKFRNYLPSRERDLADRLIYEACKDIPVWGSILDTPPEPDYKRRALSLSDRNKLSDLVLELQLQMDIELGDSS